jgi:photosystem II stability/assembly factor-like uncharacterized protein
MTINVAFEKVHSFDNNAAHDYSAGCAVLPSGLIVAGLADATGIDDHQRFFRSTDNGKSWTQGGRLPFYQPQRGPRMVHFPNGNVFFPAVENYTDCKVYKSADGGINWTLVATFTGKAPFPQNVNQPFAGRTHKKIEGQFTGHFADDGGAETANFLVTGDQGETWTMGEKLTAGGQSSEVDAIIAAGDDILWVSGDHNQSFLSDDGGETWANMGALPDPTDSTFIGVTCAAALTKDVWIAGGIGNRRSGQGTIYLWRTTDGGNNWSTLPPSAVVGYPTSGNNPWIAEAKMFTKEFCVLGFQTRGNMGNSPVRFSQDAGLTFPIEGTGWDLDGLQAEAGGAIVEAFDGSILVTVDVTEVGRVTAEIWRGTVQC